YFNSMLRLAELLLRGNSVIQNTVASGLFVTLFKTFDQGDFDNTSSTISFESSLFSDIRIILRKQLGSSESTYKQTGILGALALIKELGGASPIEDIDPSTIASSSYRPTNVTGSRKPKSKKLSQAIDLMSQ
ncbi:hypothetical protein HDU67_005853, partial [Dinochytrium kinnereticum]